MLAGMDAWSDNYSIEMDRAAAIEKAIAMMIDGFDVAVLGKGHETYQIIGSETVYFNDAEIAAEGIIRVGGKAL